MTDNPFLVLRALLMREGGKIEISAHELQRARISREDEIKVFTMDDSSVMLIELVAPAEELFEER